MKEDMINIKGMKVLDSLKPSYHASWLSDYLELSEEEASNTWFGRQSRTSIYANITSARSNAGDNNSRNDSLMVYEVTQNFK